VGVTDSVVAENVWDANFKLVCHMSDATTSTVKDSTSNDNDGTKKAANEPIETSTSKIGLAQDFDGSDDYIPIVPTFINDAQGTISAWIKMDDISASIMGLSISENGASGDEYYIFYFRGDSVKELQVGSGSSGWSANTAANVITDTNYHYFVLMSDGLTVKMYVDNVEKTLTDIGGVNTGQWFGDAVSGDTLGIGALLRATPLIPINGQIDEIQVSNSARSVAWVGASYETQRDHLITFGVDFGTTGESLYYYRDRFWTHLPKPEPIPPTPDPSTVDWSIGAIEKAKLDRDAEELLGLNKKIRKIREQEWLDHMRNTE